MKADNWTLTLEYLNPHNNNRLARQPIKCLLAIYLRFFEDRDGFPPARAAFSSFRACCFFFSASRAALVSYLIFFAEVAFVLDVTGLLAEEDFGPLARPSELSV